MTGIQRGSDALARLIDTLAEDLLDASDQDILAEAQEDRADLNSVVTARRVQFENIASKVQKAKLAAAKAAIAAQRTPATVIRLDPNSARRRLEQILAQHPETAQKLTLAARKGQGLSDDDVLGMIEDLEELGLAPDRDTQE